MLREEKGRVGERYLLTAHNVSLSDFVALVCKVAEVKHPSIPLPGSLLQAASWGVEQWAKRVPHKPPTATLKGTQCMQARVFFDTRKAREELGMPVRPPEDSVRRAVDYFRGQQ